MSNFQKLNGEIMEFTQDGLAELKNHKNIYSNDSKPISVNEREWSGWNIAALWIGIMVSIPVYMLASGLIASGMTWKQALFTIVLGHTIVIIPAVFLGHFGTRYGTSYTLLSKLTFGSKGNVFPTLVRAFMGCFWFGIQCWIGGTALNSIIAVIFKGWNNVGGHSIIAFIIFLCINVFIGYSGSKAVKFLENYAAPVLIILSLGVIAWAYKVAGGFGALISNPAAQGNGQNFWKAFFPALTAMIAFDSTIALNMSDFTRHVKSQKAQSLGQFVGAPIMTAFIVFVGVCGTVASKIQFGEALWNPADLVARFDNPLVVIIFSIFIVIATLTTNVAANLVPPGLVFSNLWPKVFTYKKAILLIGVLSIAGMPWKVLANPNNYIFEVNGTLAAFLGPMTGIYLAAYWLGHKGNVELVDLYRTDGGMYYYNNGWNIKGMIILFGVTIFVLIGKWIPTFKPIYNSSYVLGLIISFLVYWAALKITGDKN